MQPNVVGCRFTVITRSLKLALGTKTTRWFGRAQNLKI